MNKLVRRNLVRGLPTKCFENDHTCTAFLKGKQHKATCKSKLVNSVSKPLHTLHMDLFGPTSVSSISHKWYYLVVTDDFSRFTWTFFLKSKDETSGILKKFITEIENLKDLKVKITRCDNGEEFKNKEMNDFCSQKRIKREFSKARTPQQNGVAERRNRTLIEAARTMLADAKLPAHDALLESPSSKPQDHCSTEVPEGSGNLNPIASTSNPPADPMEILTVESLIPTVSSPVPTAYSTDSQEPSKESNGVEADISNMETAITTSPTPRLRIHKDHAKSQIIGPLDTPIQTRNKSKETLVDCPKGVRPIGTKWVLKNKKDERGIVIRNKARLVAQGHTQEEGIDYDEVFVPVARIKAIRLFLAYASFMGFTVYQMDVKSAFLYGTIDEEVYVMQPPGFQDPKFPAKVYKVEKTMYRLHQAPRAWYGDILKKFGYSKVRSSNTPMDKQNP
nr:ribonuclease H-like domain-containing protein [Tanacetum cinerariifolium]